MGTQLSTSEDILQAIYQQMVILNKNVNSFNLRLDAIEKEILNIKGAFVDGDITRHRNWHSKKEGGVLSRWLS